MNEHEYRSDKEWQAWMVDKFDRYVAENQATGSKVAASRDALAYAYAEAVAAGMPRWKVDLEAEGRMLFERAVTPTRSSRRSSLTKEGQYLVAALHDETILGLDDPALSFAYPLGDGRDKTLKYWSSEDWETAKTERYRNAAAATAAAAEFDYTVASPFIEALRRRDARMTGDLFRQAEK